MQPLNPLIAEAYAHPGTPSCLSNRPLAATARHAARNSDPSVTVLGDEAALLQRIHARDAGAFRQVMMLHLSAVVATGNRIVSDRAEAEDIAQEAFLRLWNQPPELVASNGRLLPWLRRVTTNLAIDQLRKTRRLDVTDEPPEQVHQPEQPRLLEAGDSNAQLERALAQLPDRQRAALVLFHFEDMSQRDVAAAMAITEDALESLLARARRKLRILLQDHWREMVSGSED